MYEESIQEMDFDMDEQTDLVIDCESESDEISPEVEISTVFTKVIDSPEVEISTYFHQRQ